jgi:hypothetical protein
MTYKYTITDAKILPVMADNTQLMDVAYDVVSVDEENVETVVASFKEGYPLGTAEETIREACQRKVDGYVSDLAKAAEEAEQNAVLQETNEVLTNLLNPQV